MNRRIVSLLIAATAVLGLTSCAGNSGVSQSDSTSASSNAQSSTTGQSVTEACLSMAQPLQEAATTMAGLSSAAADPQAAVDAWTALADAFNNVATTVSNQEVKEAAATAAGDLGAVRDSLQKIYVDGDLTAMAGLTNATTAMQTSYGAVLTLCAG